MMFISWDIWGIFLFILCLMFVLFFIKYKYKEEKTMSFYSKIFPYIFMSSSFILFFVHEDKISNDLEYYLKVSKIDNEE